MKKYHRLALALAVLVPLAFAPRAMAASVLPGVGQVSIDEGTNTLALVIPYSGRNPYRVLWLNGPRRLVVDIEGMRLPGAKRNMFIGGGVVTQIRAAHWKYDVTRVVFDLAQAADLRVTTDGATQTMRITIYPLGAQPGEPMGTVPEATPEVAMMPSAAPTPRPHATARPTVKPTAKPAAKPTPAPTATPVPGARITPVPVPTPSVEATPTPEAVLPSPEPSVAPTPMPEMTPEPLPSEEPSAVVEKEFMVFGSRLYAGAEAPLSLTETYPAGGSDVSLPGGTAGGPVATVGGVFGWDQMFTSNFGLSLGGQAMAYTIEDQPGGTNTGVAITHKRSDYAGDLRLRARLPLFAGLELAVDPGLMVRMVGVDNTAGGNAVNADQYLYTGWLGYGPSVAGHLGWHLFGPLSIAGTGEFNYLMAGGMNSTSVTPIFPLMGLKYGGELRLDMGALGLQAGYNLTSWSFSGADANNSLSQSWGGPYLKFAIVY